FGVFAPAKGAFAFFRDPNDGEQLAVNIDFLIKGPPIRKQFAGYIRAQYNDRRTVLLINFTEPAAFARLQIINVFPGINITFQNRVLSLPPFILHGISTGTKLRPLITQSGGRSLNVWQLADGLVVFKID